MVSSSTTLKLAQTFLPVKPDINSQLPLLPDSMIHHNSVISKRNKLIVSYSRYMGKRYGVSSVSKLLPVSLFTKKYEYIERCLGLVVGLSQCEVEAVMRLLRIETYYGEAYPKASHIAGDIQDPPPQLFVPYLGYVPPKRHHLGTSRATFWRAIHHLKELGLVTVVNRYVLREHAQISNLYKLDKLLIIIAKYLAEHTGRLWPKWVEPYLSLTWPKLWDVLRDAGRYDVPPLHLSILPL